MSKAKVNEFEFFEIPNEKKVVIKHMPTGSVFIPILDNGFEDCDIWPIRYESKEYYFKFNTQVEDYKEIEVMIRDFREFYKNHLTGINNGTNL